MKYCVSCMRPIAFNRAFGPVQCGAPECARLIQAALVAKRVQGSARVASVELRQAKRAVESMVQKELGL